MQEDRPKLPSRADQLVWHDELQKKYPPGTYVITIAHLPNGQVAVFATSNKVEHVYNITSHVVKGIERGGIADYRAQEN